MTDPNEPTPTTAIRPNPPQHDRPQQDAPQHADETVVVFGDVPVAIWRLDDRDDTDDTDDTVLTSARGGQLAPRLAQRLVLVYTQRSEAIVDFDTDPQLAHASTYHSRTYLAIAVPSAIADLDTLTEPVSLVVLGWPPKHANRTPASVTDLFAACRLIMTADACAIVVINSAAPEQPGTTHTKHLDELLPAAHTAGLTQVLEIIAITAPSDGDQYTYHASSAEAEAARQGWSNNDASPRYQVDLLVFSRSRG